MLILDTGLVSVTAALWARSLSAENWSDAKIEAHLRAIGTFYAYCKARCGDDGPTDADLYLLVCDFAEARFRGTYSPDGEDVYRLYWDRIQISSVQNELRALERYSKFVAKLKQEPAVERSEDQLVSAARSYAHARSCGRSDAMVHLRGVRRNRPTPQLVINDRTSQRRFFNYRARHLSPDEMIDVIENGCRTPRDRMLLLLLGYAGLRISEPLHIFVDDVMSVFEETGAAKIRLEHPVNGCCDWTEDDNRSGFLARSYGRLPRNQLGRGHREFAGWKGMVLTEGDPRQRYAFWLEEGVAGRYFRSCLEEYVDDNKGLLRAGRMRHPYLFFNTAKTGSPNSYGEPMTITNAHEIFNSAARRVGLKAGSHTCRHHYGFYAADVLGVPQETLMRMMHHSSIVSTDTYYNVSAQNVRARISGQYIRRIPYRRPSFPGHWSGAWK